MITYFSNRFKDLEIYSEPGEDNTRWLNSNGVKVAFDDKRIHLLFKTAVTYEKRSSLKSLIISGGHLFVTKIE